MSDRPGLTGVPSRELEELLRALGRRHVSQPLNRAQLQALGCPSLVSKVDLLSGLDDRTLEALLTAVLAERRAVDRPALDVVWTGPEPRVSSTRDTRVVVRDLFSRAESSVLIAGFRFDHGTDILAALHRRMRDHGVAARIFLDLFSAAGEPEPGGFLAKFLDENWPFGDPHPSFYFDPRSLESRTSSLHAKCVVVDNRRTFITSANFTDRGQTRNIELGLLVEDPELARSVSGHWLSLANAGLMQEIVLPSRG